MPRHHTVHLHTHHTIAPVDRRVFGGFLEHMGRAVYGGVYEPESPHADADGWRSDVLEALRGLDMTAMRYPGGNFVSGYHWQDGVGPREARPRLRELAWNSVEPNAVGTDEFLALAARMGWEPMMAVNLGTGTPEEARNWVEYTNAATGTKYADLRAENGREKPWGVKLWCLGNEMDGHWQIGHVPAEEYGLRAQQTAKLIKDLDREAELVVCGSSMTFLPSYLEWDRTVLERVGDHADYLSLHSYVGNRNGDTLDFLACPGAIDRQIEAADATCRYVAARRRSPKRAYLSFDEWNVWYKTFSGEHMNGAGRFAPPLIEERYNLEDALVVAGFLHSFVRHADVVKIANLAQIVNVIAPILAQPDGLLLQSIYWPFVMFSRRRNGTALRTAVEGDRYDAVSYGSTSHVDASAILDGERLHVFVTNRDEGAAEVRIRVADTTIAACVDAELLAGPDPKTENDWDAPERVHAAGFEDVRIRDGEAVLSLPAWSFAAVSLRLG
ncbi:alpha-L-arabinofuranosidase C-terminal domain-containing protein [Nocardioides sp.]|uniref:alpha-N-arabinofuranosidase n=1 Tax=Nocardioides sp. TaxID=35761 RepID=UPI00260CB9C2|nr:alpha-L-arabinofuranosidase C-terminal domain-containing protein [Nocardioides sp.]